jgi:hypothetical protein
VVIERDKKEFHCDLNESDSDILHSYGMVDLEGLA